MGSPFGGEAADATLPRKASREVWECPYRKPTQVGGCNGTKASERTLAKELGKLAP